MTVPAFLALIGLGTWQVERLAWKEGLIRTLESRSSAPPIPLPADAGSIEESEYHRVRLEGEWLHDRELFLTGQTYNGQAGWDVVTPFRNLDGALVLVDRGWIPFERKNPAMRKGGQIEGPTMVDALILKDLRRGYFQPDNEPQRNLWFWVDTAAMARAAALASVKPYLLVALRHPIPGGFPVGGEIKVALRNDHLSYAITWYSLALALLVIYGLYHTKRME
ncbi:MAG: SURF1 family protein [Proteobacteria bacterium]|nr:SURF1 family protein [Pseudomonadota bacterium]